MKPRLHRSPPAVQGYGHLGLAEAVVKAQHHRRPVLRLQVPQGISHSSPEFGLQRGIGRSEGVGVFQGDLLVHGASQFVQGAADRDAVKPRREGTPRIVSRYGGEKLNEDLLGDVLGLVVIARNAVSRPEDRLVMELKESTQGPPALQLDTG